MTYQDDRNRRLDRRDGMSGGAIAAIAIFAIIVLGAIVYSFTGERSGTSTANAPSTSQSAPATTGQGGAQSKVPQKNAQ